MAKNPKRRAWTSADVRTLKTLRQKEDTSIKHCPISKNEPWGLLCKRHSARDCPSILGPETAQIKSSEVRAGHVWGFHFRSSMAEAIKKLPPRLPRGCF